MTAPAGVSRRVSLLVLVAANAVVLWGVLAQGWAVFPILFLFWLENVIVGVLNVARMVCARPGDGASWGRKLFFVPFFCVHYGMFTLGHGVFVFALFGDPAVQALADGVDLLAMPAAALRVVDALHLWVPALALAASHGFSFVWNYLLGQEYRHTELRTLMSKPYARVAVLHVTILAGGALAMFLGSPLWALILLLVLKTGIDAAAHLKEHRTLAPDPESKHPAHNANRRP